MKTIKSVVEKAIFLSSILCLYCCAALARVGGGGGRSSSHSSSHSSSSSHSFSGNGGSGSFSPGLVVVIIIILVLYFVFKNKFKASNKEGLLGGNVQAGTRNDFPEGLTTEKISTSFMELQAAWQQQDLGKVRKWMSDGVYQRFHVQFAMMKKLSQHNRLSNIRISNISLADQHKDGAYQSADVAITFSMDDEFISDQYPALNQSFMGDSDTEYWTFIKRNDAQAGNADLYNSNNCPNCGALLENKSGEVSRCSSCNTLTNNAAYDWILSEITQMEDYTGKNPLLADSQFQTIVQNDPLFSIQRLEDIASNVFMQIMEVMSGGNNKKLSRFADPALAGQMLQQKAGMEPFVFDRLYLNEVTLTAYRTDAERLNLQFDLSASYQRVQTGGTKLRVLDNDISIHRYRMTLSKDIAALTAQEKEVVFSYECASCGAPYQDTTNDTCSYCDAPVVDTSRNWVLTAFTIL